jgi:formylglycine-generating enzyme required for sulfatase activity
VFTFARHLARLFPANSPQWIAAYNAKFDQRRLGGLIVDGAMGRPAIRSQIPRFQPNQWIVFEVIVQGTHIEIKLDGVKTADYLDYERHYSQGHIALQQHGTQTVVEFRRIEIKELTPVSTALVQKSHSASPEDVKANASRPAEGFVPLFNGRDKKGWRIDGGDPEVWRVDGGVLIVRALNDWRRQSFLLSESDFSDFVLRFEFQLPENTDSGIVLRAIPGEQHIEVNLRNFVDPPEFHAATAALRWSVNGRGADYSPPDRPAQLAPDGTWNKMEITLRGTSLQVSVNGREVRSTDLRQFADRPSALPGLKRRSGRIGFQSHTGTARFQKIEVEELIDESKAGAGNGGNSEEKKGSNANDATNPLTRKTIRNSIGLTLQIIPAGEFMMGSQEHEVGATAEEKPRHKVRISSFYLGTYEVTQSQYAAVTGANPSWFCPTAGGKDKVDGRSTGQHPVESVAWLDAVVFCNTLSQKEGRSPYYQVSGENAQISDRNASGYRLPTEAEWEYACRSGSTEKYAFGDEPWMLAKHGWFRENSDYTSHPVGEKRPNDYGLYDMYGNVWEWCSDWFDDSYYKRSPRDDPPGAVAAKDRVRRGGGMGSNPNDMRSAYRLRSSPARPRSDLGFRVALNAAGEFKDLSGSVKPGITLSDDSITAQSRIENTSNKSREP